MMAILYSSYEAFSDSLKILKTDINAEFNVKGAYPERKMAWCELFVFKTGQSNEIFST